MNARALIVPLLAATACSRTATVDANALSFLQVEVVSGAAGTAEEPLPFSADPVTVGLRVQALDRDAEPLAVDALLGLRVRPGDIEGEDTVRLSGGTWEGEVSFRYGFGPTRVWFVDDQDADGRVPSQVAGVSGAFWYALPTLAQVQATDDHETNPLDGEFTEIRCEDRRVIVVATGADGMWVTDLDDPPGGYNSLFVYTFNKPDYAAAEEGEYEGDVDRDVAPGDQLAVLSGGNQEYLATTQLSFPMYEFVGGESLAIPDPVELDATTACDDDAMEQLEAALVRASDVTIPESFSASDDDYADYGQWPIQLGSCTIYAESAGTVPEFMPTDYAGERLDYIQGMLTEVWGKWIILPRDADDISLAGRSMASRPASGHPARPPRRPRPPVRPSHP